MDIIKVCYSVEPRDIYLKGYGFLSFAKSIGKIISNKYSQKLVDCAKKSLQMSECNSIETSNLDNQQLLNKINEIKDYFIAEDKEKELMSKRLSKYIASFAIVAGAPVAIASASLSLTLSISIIKNNTK